MNLMSKRILRFPPAVVDSTEQINPFLVLEIFSGRRRQHRVSPSRPLSRLLFIVVVLDLRTGTVSYDEESE